MTRKKAFTWPWTRKKQFFKDGLKTFSDREIILYHKINVKLIIDAQSEQNNVITFLAVSKNREFDADSIKEHL